MEVVQKMNNESYNYDTEFDTTVLMTSSGYDASMDVFDVSHEDIGSSSCIKKSISTSNSLFEKCSVTCRLLRQDVQYCFEKLRNSKG
jgi:hypothetical protein